MNEPPTIPMEPIRLPASFYAAPRPAPPPPRFRPLWVLKTVLAIVAVVLLFLVVRVWLRAL